MAQLLGLGMTHYPGLPRHDENMSALFRRTLASPKVPDVAKDPRNWPAAMREEWGNDQGVAAARASRAVLQRLSCFA